MAIIDVVNFLKLRAWQDNRMVYPNSIGNYSLAGFMASLYEDTPLMMYSGHQDLHGNDVYNGDIVNLKSFVRNDDIRKAEVLFNNGEFYLKALDNGEEYGFLYLEEVLGNIYE